MRASGPHLRRSRSAIQAYAVAFALIGAALPGRVFAQQASVELDTLVVRVESRLSIGRVTRAVEVLTRSQIEALPARSVSEALAWSVGAELDSRSPAQSDVSIRGSSYEQVVVLVNGVRMSDPQTGHFDLDLAVPLVAVERIEILRGTASSLFGADAVGGVINIVTRAPSDTSGEVSAETGSFGTRHSALRFTRYVGRVGIAASGDWSDGDGHRSGTDYRVRQGLVEARTTLGAAAIRIEGAWAERAFGAEGFYAPFSSWEETTTRAGVLHVEVPVGRVVVQQRGWRRSHDDDFVLKRADPAFYRNVHTSSQDGVEVVGRTGLGARGALAVGGEWVRESLVSTLLGDRQEDRFGAFGEVALSSGATDVRLGGRVDHYEAFGSVATPSFSAGVRANDRLRVRGSVGKAFRSPTWTERFYEDPANKGRADLAPEKAWTADLGVDLAIQGASLLRLTVFTRQATDLIDWARASDESVWETRNVERADFAGIEADVDGVTFGSLRAHLVASVTRVEAHESAGLESKYALRPVNRKLMVGLARPLGGGAWLSVSLLHERREGQDAYARADGRLRVSAGPGEVSVDARNLLDAHYADVSRELAPGRAFSVGYRLRFGDSGGG